MVFDAETQTLSQTSLYAKIIFPIQKALVSLDNVNQKNYMELISNLKNLEGINDKDILLEKAIYNVSVWNNKGDKNKNYIYDFTDKEHTAFFSAIVNFIEDKANGIRSREISAGYKDVVLYIQDSMPIPILFIEDDKGANNASEPIDKGLSRDVVKLEIIEDEKKRGILTDSKFVTYRSSILVERVSEDDLIWQYITDTQNLQSFITKHYDRVIHSEKGCFTTRHAKHILDFFTPHNLAFMRDDFLPRFKREFFPPEVLSDLDPKTPPKLLCFSYYRFMYYVIYASLQLIKEGAFTPSKTPSPNKDGGSSSGKRDNDYNENIDYSDYYYEGGDSDDELYGRNNRLSFLNNISTSYLMPKQQQQQQNNTGFRPRYETREEFTITLRQRTDQHKTVSTRFRNMYVLELTLRKFYTKFFVLYLVIEKNGVLKTAFFKGNGYKQDIERQIKTTKRDASKFSIRFIDNIFRYCCTGLPNFYTKGTSLDLAFYNLFSDPFFVRNVDIGEEPDKKTVLELQKFNAQNFKVSGKASLMITLFYMLQNLKVDLMLGSLNVHYFVSGDDGNLRFLTVVDGGGSRDSRGSYSARHSSRYRGGGDEDLLVDSNNDSTIENNMKKTSESERTELVLMLRFLSFVLNNSNGSSSSSNSSDQTKSLTAYLENPDRGTTKSDKSDKGENVYVFAGTDGSSVTSLESALSATNTNKLTLNKGDFVLLEYHESSSESDYKSFVRKVLAIGNTATNRLSFIKIYKIHSAIVHIKKIYMLFCYLNRQSVISELCFA
jgi:hypothetical protein